MVSVCREDSQDIQENHRAEILASISSSPCNKVIITHGTDTMIETAVYLADKVEDKVVVITGAFLPETFKDSDADFNLGVAIGKDK